MNIPPPPPPPPPHFGYHRPSPIGEVAIQIALAKIQAKSHDVSQSDFAKRCVELAEGLILEAHEADERCEEMKKG